MKSNKLFRSLIFSLSLSIGLIAGNSLVFAHHGESHNHHGYHNYHGHHNFFHGHHHGDSHHKIAPIPKSQAVAPPKVVEKTPPPAPVVKAPPAPVVKEVVKVAQPPKDEFVITMSGKENRFEVKNGSLTVSGMKLSLLPSGLKARTDLKQFAVKGTGLIGISNWIGVLSNLETLSVPGNQIKSLPNELANLTKLQKLDLSGNPLNGFPAVLSKMKSLKEVVLPKALEGDAGLKTLPAGVKVSFSG